MKKHGAMEKSETMQKLFRDWLLTSVLLGSGALFPLGCESDTDGPTIGSESHFLKSCERDAECGKLSCLCGVCSSVCEDATSCTSLHGAAECVANTTRPTASTCPTPPDAMCDVRCETQADCSWLDPDAECAAGFCREAPSGSDSDSDSDGTGGSGGAPSTSDIADDGRIELDEVCAMYQDSVCKQQLSCEADPGFCDEAHCRDAVGCGQFEALRASIDRGHLGFDPVALATCYAAFLDDPCHFTYGLVVAGIPRLQTLLNACPGVLTPRQDLGAECYGEQECVFGTACDHELACPGTCVADERPKGEAGDPCTTVIGPEQDCVQPLVCLLSPDPDTGEQACGPAPNAGDPCDSANDCRCNGPQELCQSLSCDLSLGECVPRARVGEACSLLDATGVPDCLAPAWCDGGFDGGICRPPSGLGEPCSSFSNCQEALTCIDGACVPAVGPGENCSFGGDCVRGDCVDDICTALGAPGDACDSDRDCAIGSMCSEGACRPFSCPGDACSTSTPCLEGRCVAGSCVPWARPGDACSSDSECAGHPTAGELVCQAGVCTAATECW